MTVPFRKNHYQELEERASQHWGGWTPDNAGGMGPQRRWGREKIENKHPRRGNEIKQ